MAEIALVGGMVGDSLKGVTYQGMLALQQAERVVFPGDWLGENLLAFFGERLVYGREVSVQKVLEVFSDVARGVVLYAGDPRMFTGRPSMFPSAAGLAKLLEAHRHSVEWLSGLSLIQLSLNAAGVSLEVNGSDALVITPPLFGENKGRDELTYYAHTRSVLVMLWAEEEGRDVWKALSAARSPKTHVTIVSRLGMADEKVHQGELGDFEELFTNIAIPSTIVVWPSPEKA